MKPVTQEQSAPVHQAVPLQRVGAYLVCLRSGAVLLTQLSANTPRPGAWTLPGGGIDHGEHPRDAVIRETWEETGLRVMPGSVVTVDSQRFIGHAPSGQYQDFHSIRVVYTGVITDGRRPRVVEVGGSSADAAWVPLAQLVDVEITELVVRAIRAAQAQSSDG